MRRSARSRAILHTEAGALNALLTAIGADRDWVRRTGPARPGVAGLGPGNRPPSAADRMRATKLIALKRPSVPDWNSVVSQVLGTERSHLNPVREALRADDGAFAPPVAVDPGGGRPPRGDLRIPSVRCERLDGRQERRPGWAL
ncbi:DUF6308 family protein [Rhodococcus aetherivorans]